MCTLFSPVLEHEAEQTVVICRAAVTLEKSSSQIGFMDHKVMKPAQSKEKDHIAL